MTEQLCIGGRCRSPVACGGFGYCRERNNDGRPMDEANVARRKQESAEERSLARKGFAEYARGLWTDDGTPAGSGYACTQSGRNALYVARVLEAAQ